MTNIKLYGYSTSPFVRKVAACLYYKKLTFEHVPVNPVNPEETIGFTGASQVPVLMIGDEWKVDSTPIALWLDACFPDRPLLPENQEMRTKILDIDHWLNESFLPSSFRSAVDGKNNLAFKFMGWRLAAIVSAHTPLPENVRNQWPDLLRKAPFILEMIEQLDRDESLSDMQMRLGMEMVKHLGSGPFFGETDSPTLVDFALFQQLVFPYMAGLTDKMQIDAVPPLKAWSRNVAKHLPKNPVLIPDNFVVAYLD